jgi:hypothetical protein
MSNPIEPTPAHVELERGSHAAAALENPLIAEALAAWETEITESWKTSPLRDVEGREKMRLMLEAAQVFRRHLLRTMETGQLQRVQMQQQRTWLERVKSVGRQ